MLRFLTLFISLVCYTCASAQDYDIHVRETNIIEMDAGQYYNWAIARHREEGKGQRDSFLAAMPAMTDSLEKAWGRTVFESGARMQLWGNVFANFDFRYDSSKLYLVASNPSRFLHSKDFAKVSYDITFADGSVIKHQKPFATSFDDWDVFLLLDGSMEVLEFDKQGKPAGTRVLHGDAKLLKKMQQVPVRSISISSACDMRFKEYAANCQNNGFVMWGLLDESGEVAMDCLNRLCREIKKERR